MLRKYGIIICLISNMLGKSQVLLPTPILDSCDYIYYIAQDTDFIFIEIIGEYVRQKLLSGEFDPKDNLDHILKNGGIYFDPCNYKSLTNTKANLKNYIEISCMRTILLKEVKNKYGNIYENTSLLNDILHESKSKYAHLWDLTFEDLRKRFN